VGLKIEYIDGQTPLSEEDKRGLLIDTISTQGELNQFEQKNIAKAIQWTGGKNISQEKLLSEKYIVQLHKKMYGAIWKWAGEFRTTETNIGVQPYVIGIELRQLLDDTKYWIKNEIYESIEIALRFKHRLVSIHCFPNGNGRHSRLMADLIMEKIYDVNYFSWGGSNLLKADELRKQYIASLKQADNGNMKDLIDFADS